MQREPGAVDFLSLLAYLAGAEQERVREFMTASKIGFGNKHCFFFNDFPFGCFFVKCDFAFD